ncbi:hypothetical protein PMIN01_09617 [Paraphaeosphaeria minitans]|uniref:Uncharacterized protein n=1 Tax=Paraphaeosphaeria minitans TaxID=565426 RepID=A0A9P6KNP1_9PLEO|nr:hypothetical protein PMIN01_09617 [Paraphaeosphaeria minitans]
MASDDCAVFTLNSQRARQLKLYRVSPLFGKVANASTDPRKYRRRGFAHRSVSDRLQVAGEQRGGKQRKRPNDKRGASQTQTQTDTQTDRHTDKQHRQTTQTQTGEQTKLPRVSRGCCFVSCSQARAAQGGRVHLRLCPMPSPMC